MKICLKTFWICVYASTERNVEKLNFWIPFYPLGCQNLLWKNKAQKIHEVLKTHENKPSSSFSSILNAALGEIQCTVGNIFKKVTAHFVDCCSVYFVNKISLSTIIIIILNAVFYPHWLALLRTNHHTDELTTSQIIHNYRGYWDRIKCYILSKQH